MVVTDVFLPDFTGGARRTTETARALSKLGHQVTILCNRRSTENPQENMENFEIFRVKMIEIGENIRIAIGNAIRAVSSIFNKRVINKSPNRTYVSYLDRNVPKTVREKLSDFYRHKFPLHKIMKWFPAIFRLVKIIKENEIDLVYERGPSYGLGILASKLTGRPSIIDFIDIMYWNWALRNSTRVLSYFTNYQVPSFIDRSKIDIVYTSTDLSRFNPNNSDFQRDQNIKGKIGVYVGGFYHWHGLEYIVKAVAHLKTNYKTLRVIAYASWGKE